MLGRTLGFSLSAGINLYATTALIGLAARYDWVLLPPQFEVFDNDVVIYGALVMYAIEFVADKVPWVDSLWDGVHTLIRPLGGALIAVAALGEAAPVVQVLVALLGGTVAAGSHFAKAGTRAVVNTSPEPFSNSVVSVLEDMFVFVLAVLALALPLVALGVAAVLLVLIVMYATRLVRAARRRWRPRRALPSG